MYHIRYLTIDDTKEIISWYQEDHQAFYLQAKEHMENFLDGHGYAVVNEDKELCGYVVYGEGAVLHPNQEVYQERDLLDMTIRMNPKACGQGKGRAFLEKVIAFSEKTYFDTGLRVTLPMEEEAAQKLYAEHGFTRCGHYDNYIILCRQRKD